MCLFDACAGTRFQLWRRPVSPVVPYRNETRYDVALPDEAINNFNKPDPFVDRQGKLNKQLGSPASPVRRSSEQLGISNHDTAPWILLFRPLDLL